MRLLTEPDSKVLFGDSIDRNFYHRFFTTSRITRFLLIPRHGECKSTVLLTIRCLSISYKVCFVKFTSNRNLLSLIRFISSYTTISLSLLQHRAKWPYLPHFHISFLSLVSYYPNLDDPLFRNWSTSCASRLCFLHHDCIDTVSLYLLC